MNDIALSNELLRIIGEIHELSKTLRLLSTCTNKWEGDNS